MFTGAIISGEPGESHWFGLESFEMDFGFLHAFGKARAEIYWTLCIMKWKEIFGPTG